MDRQADRQRGTEAILASDGLPALRVGAWWKDEHFYVQRYVDILNVGMYKKWDARPYVELFAGPGRCVVDGSDEEIDGSPLVAFRGRKLFTHYIFADSNRDFVEALQTRVRTQDASEARVAYFAADCNAAIDEIVAVLPEARSSLGLVFIDPYNWEIHLETIEKLTTDRRFDLLITLHTGQIRRWAEQSPHEFDQFFGGSGWYDEYLAERRSHRSVRALVNVYERRLKGLGYDHVDDEIIVFNRQHGLLYQLVFASKNPQGKNFWQKISRRSWSGQARLL